jgi:phage pi2 protein 07
MIKFISKEVYDHIISADKESLLKMQKELSSEISKGLLTEPKYQKELDLINSRLV